MKIVLPLYKFSIRLKPLDDALVRILYEDSLPIRDLICETACRIDRTYGRNACTLEDIVVVLSESRSGMYDAATIFGSYIIPADYDERTLLLEV